MVDHLMDKFSRYEVARIVGARALQIAMNAPLLVKLSKEDLEKIQYDVLKIAEIELESGVLPISVKRPLPSKKDEKLKRVKASVSDKKLEKRMSEDEELAREGEIMELVNPEEEMEEERENEGEEE